MQGCASQHRPEKDLEWKKRDNWSHCSTQIKTWEWPEWQISETAYQNTAHTPFLALTGDTALPARSFTESADTSQNAVLQMPQYREHSSAGQPWQAAEVATHLHALMGFYCDVHEQIKKQYLLIWGRTKERSASGTNTTPLPHTLKHSFEFFTVECFWNGFSRNCDWLCNWLSESS